MAVSTDPGDIKDTDALGHNLGDERLSTNPNDNYSLSDADKAKFDDISKNYDKDESPDGSSGSDKSGTSSSSQQSQAKSSTSSKSSSSSSSSSSSGPSSKFGSAIRVRRNGSSNYALIAVMIAAILSGGFFAILPLKLESMMKNIFEHRIETRLKHYMAGRLDAKIKKYVKDSVGETDPEFEANIANDDPATKDFEQEYRDADAEKLLQEDDRITLTRAGGTVEVAKDSASLGTIDEAGGLAASSEGFLNLTHGLIDMYRAPFRFMASKLWGIAKWAFFSGENDPNKAQAEVVTELVADESIQVAQGNISAADCAIGEGNCSTDEANPNANDRIVQTDPDTQASQTGDSQDSTVTGAVEQGTADGTSKAKQYLSKLSYLNYLNPNHYIALVVSKLVSKYISQAVVQVVSKAFSAAAGPLIIIAAVDIASRIDHFFWDGGADKLITNIHKIQYAAEFVEWGIIDDQWKSGQNVSGAEVNAVNGMLNGTENSAASRTIYGTGTGGQTLYESDANPTQPDPSARSIDEHAHPIEDEYKNVILPTIAGQVGGINVVLANIPGIGIFFHFSNEVEAYAIHYLLQAWYDTLGHVWSLLQSLLGIPVNLILAALRHIPGIGTAIDWITQHIGVILADLLGNLIKPAVDGTEVGADLMNGIDAGGAVAGMDFARTLGGHMLTPTQSTSLNKEIADEQVQEAAHMSLATRLFSPNYAQSGVNLLALQLPSTPSGVMNDSLSYAASIFTNPFQAFTPALQIFGLGKANADALYDDQYGLYDWGFTDADLQGDDTAALNQAYQTAATRLNEPVSKVHLQDIELEDCPMQPGEDTGGGAATANLCRLDIATMRASSAAFDNTDDGGTQLAVVKRLFAATRVIAVIACVIGPNVGYAITSTDYNSIVNDTPFYDANDGCASGGGSAGTGAAQGDNNATIAYSYLVGQGLSTAGAAGVVGNMIEESGVGPERLQGTPGNQVTTAAQVISLGDVNSGSIGWGIVQWTPPSQIITGSNPSPSVGTLYYQLSFFFTELSTKYSTVYDQMKIETSAVGAAVDFLNGFEHGSPSVLRETNALAIYDYEVNHVPLPQSVLDQIVSGAAANVGTPGSGPTSGGCGSSTTALSGNCQNPIRDVKGLIPLRVDQGVDYEGTGPVYPICDSTVFLVEPDSGAGWPGDGDFIAYKVNGNAVDGKTLPANVVVYYSEDCVAAAGLHSGQALTTSQVLCNQNEGGTNVETGWSETGILTSALGHTDPCWNGGSATNYGQNFSALMKALGAPPGDLTRSSGVCTTPLPAGWPTW